MLISACSRADSHKFSVRSKAFYPEPLSAEDIGLAGAFIGLVDNQIIVAGGSNFSEGKPWEGGKKQYSDKIFTISIKAYQTTLSELKLPKPLAHGCAVVTDNSLYCVGGQNAEGQADEIFAIDCPENGLRIRNISKLPQSFSPVAALSCNGLIYIHGIEQDTNALYCYRPDSTEWKQLSGCPGGPHNAGPAFVMQNNGREDVLYLIGGRYEAKDTMRLFSDIWEYSPSLDNWSLKGSILVNGISRNNMYAACIPFGKDRILLLGGDDGKELLRRDSLARAIKTAAQTQSNATDMSNSTVESLEQQLRDAFIQHGGFSKEILAYNTLSNTWTVFAEAEQPLPAVTSAVQIGKDIVIPSGEIHPGVRSKDIFIVNID